MNVLLACFLLSFLSILYFSNSMLVCVCYPGWRVFRTSHTCVYPFPTFPTAFLHVYYFGMRVFRTNHTCIYPFLTQFSHRIARLYAFIVPARVFLERATHAFSLSSQSTFPTAISSRVMFLERAIHAFSVPLTTFPTAFYIRLLFRLAC